VTIIVSFTASTLNEKIVCVISQPLVSGIGLAVLTTGGNAHSYIGIVDERRVIIMQTDELKALLFEPKPLPFERVLLDWYTSRWRDQGRAGV
jgi:hypothetical protein